MKKIYLMAIAALFCFGLTSCEEFLDSENYTETNTGNYPASPNDLNKELSALYGVMNQYGPNQWPVPWLINHMMSDDALGGGGTTDAEVHAVGHLMASSESMYSDLWHCTYVGIARANSIIYAVDAFDWTGNEAIRNQLLGEAYFMRGLFYMWGSQFWGNIPAYWSAAAPDPCPQQDAETVIWPHILADFVSAANLMSHGATTLGDGHATKGAAEGMLGRAYMFYEGFYKKAGELASANLADVELPEQEGVTGALSKAQVANYLEDAINNSGYSLVSDFRLLWQYTNELTAADYPYVADLAANNQFWAGNGNSEEMFQIQFGNFASWSSDYTMGYTDMSSLCVGLRCDEDASGSGRSNGKIETLPFGQGWGQGIMTPTLWNDWSDADPRKRATILNVTEECPMFVYSSTCTEETGLYDKKRMPFTTSQSNFDDFATGPYTWWGVYRVNNTDAANNNGNSFQGDHFADVILLRLADVMLMHSELTGTATYMNQVQKRAGVAQTGYSWTNIQNERRWELAGEGIRFNDLRRWSGINSGENGMAAKALQKQEGVKIHYGNKEAALKHASSSWAKRYAETDGFLQIPASAINVIDDEEVLKQNPGWGDDVNDWNLTGVPSY